MNAIQKLLIDKQLTQEKLAKELGVVQGMVGNWIREKNKVSPEKAIMIEEKFGVPCEEFCEILGKVKQMAIISHTKKAKGKKGKNGNATSMPK